MRDELKEQLYNYVYAEQILGFELEEIFRKEFPGFTDDFDWFCDNKQSIERRFRKELFEIDDKRYKELEDPAWFIDDQIDQIKDRRF